MGIYADEGITGTSQEKRVEFQRLMNDCREGKIDKIYSKSISRFARNTKDCLTCIRMLKTFGVTVYFEKENVENPYSTPYTLKTVSQTMAQGIDCSGLIWWTLTNLGYKTSGFGQNNPVPADTFGWLGSTGTKTITYGGVTANIEIEKSNLPMTSRRMTRITSL